MVVNLGLAQVGKKERDGRKWIVFCCCCLFFWLKQLRHACLQWYTSPPSENRCSGLLETTVSNVCPYSPASSGMGRRQCHVSVDHALSISFMMLYGLFSCLLAFSASEQSDDDPVCPGAGVGAEHGAGQAICLALLGEWATPGRLPYQCRGLGPAVSFAEQKSLGGNLAVFSFLSWKVWVCATWKFVICWVALLIKILIVLTGNTNHGGSSRRWVKVRWFPPK